MSKIAGNTAANTATNAANAIQSRLSTLDLRQTSARDTRQAQSTRASATAHRRLGLTGFKTVQIGMLDARPLVFKDPMQAAEEIYQVLQQQKSDAKETYAPPGGDKLSASAAKKAIDGHARRLMNESPSKPALVEAMQNGWGLKAFARGFKTQDATTAFRSFVLQHGPGVQDPHTLAEIADYLGARSEKQFLGFLNRVKRAQGDAKVANLIDDLYVRGDLNRFTEYWHMGYYTSFISCDLGSVSRAFDRLQDGKKRARSSLDAILRFLPSNSPTRVGLENEFQNEWNEEAMWDFVGTVISRCLEEASDAKQEAADAKREAAAAKQEASEAKAAASSASDSDSNTENED